MCVQGWVLQSCPPSLPVLLLLLLLLLAVAGSQASLAVPAQALLALQAGSSVGGAALVEQQRY